MKTGKLYLLRNAYVDILKRETQTYLSSVL